MSGPRLYDQEGRPVRLGPELGRGGEGAVFEVAGAPDQVAVDGLSPQLAAYLSSPAVNDRTDDDKTLVLAARELQEGAVGAGGADRQQAGA